jgi:hypothetical protein
MKPSQCCPGGPNLTAVAGPNQNARINYKIRRLISRGESQDRAIELIDTTDKARAAFVRQYLGLRWPEPHLYHAMFNTAMGESSTAAMLIECVRQLEHHHD